MKPLRWISPILICLVVVGFGLFGVKYRSTYTDLTAQPNYTQDFMVAELSGEMCTDACQYAAQELPKSPIIARVTPTEELEPLCRAARQKFQVLQVFKGEGLTPGDTIYIGKEHGWSILPNSNPSSLEYGYTNAPQPGREYLVFLSGQAEIVDGFPTIPTYLMPNFARVTPTPFFCYEDFGTMEVVPCDGFGTYVPYSQVSGNEFFSTTQEGLERMLELKHSLLEQYPKGV